MRELWIAAVAVVLVIVLPILVYLSKRKHPISKSDSDRDFEDSYENKVRLMGGEFRELTCPNCGHEFIHDQRNMIKELSPMEIMGMTHHIRQCPKFKKSFE